MEENENGSPERENYFRGLGKFHAFLLAVCILLLPLIGIMAWQNIGSREDPTVKQNTSACEYLKGHLVEKDFPTGKKNIRTAKFNVCEENGTGKIVMATGKAYEGKDTWTDSCVGKVFSLDKKSGEGVSRSLICINDGKVSKATVLSIN